MIDLKSRFINQVKKKPWFIAVLLIVLFAWFNLGFLSPAEVGSTGSVSANQNQTGLLQEITPTPDLTPTVITAQIIREGRPTGRIVGSIVILIIILISTAPALLRRQSTNHTNKQS
jgi:hypothetical protein